MMEVSLECSSCHCNRVKNGKSKNGTQRYNCKRCGRYSQKVYSYRACGKGISGKIIAVTREGCGIRSIARLLNISIATVMSRIKAIGRSISRPFAILKGKTYEVDEMRTYIGNKSRLYGLLTR